jgi:hemerythrin-like metal-binding protein
MMRRRQGGWRLKFLLFCRLSGPTNEDYVVAIRLVQWSTKYSVDVSFLDDQHRVLFELINELHVAMLDGNGNRVAPSILKRLLDYTRTHFSAEEAFMVRTNYPDFSDHKAAHEKLIAKLIQMCGDFAKGEKHLSSRLLGFLRNWLRSHILDMDKRYAKHMNAADVN